MRKMPTDGLVPALVAGVSGRGVANSRMIFSV
jgi:hypothetical protein